MSTAPATTLHAAERLTPDDDLFVRMEHAIGLAVVNQTLWRLPADYDTAILTELADRLRVGRLGKLVRRRRIPVRDRWIHTPAAGRFHFSPTPVPSGETIHWADARAAEPVDSIHGPAWRLAAARVDDADGDILVSLICSHVIADGGATFAAFAEAFGDIDFDTRDVLPGRVDEIREAATVLASAGRAAAGIVRAGGALAPQATGVNRRLPQADEPAERTPTGVPNHAVTVDEQAFLDTAAAAGGTANTLFIAIAVGVLARTGRIHTGDEIGVNLPVSTRADGDRRANATSAVTARIVVDDDRYADLGTIRAASKSAFASLRERPPSSQFGVLGQALGDKAIRRLTGSMTTPLCLVSNIGRLDHDFAALGGSTPVSVVSRAVTPGADTETLRRWGGGISAWMSQSAGVFTLSFICLDPDAAALPAALAELVHAELDRWGLPANTWDR
ncbi:hypothetical protein AAFP35_07200 [Gordonia sp. CPCC 206044]|uniref:hypothetical protein n=1 Tax=Gordonia sp. CPCC 206044 TaxID=3140793 RepID=UPI003AF39B61